MDDHFLDLEVDVNGEEVFLVNKRVISSYSGKISKISNKSRGETCRLKIIFDDFPGGASTFEEIIRFCYNKGNVVINPSNISQLTCASHFMEMNKSFSGVDNLSEQTMKSLHEIKFWSWSDILLALKHSQHLVNRHCSTLIDKCLDSLVAKVASSFEISSSPSISSSDTLGFRTSCDTRSTVSFKTGSTTWWFEDLVALNVDIVRNIVQRMVSSAFDHGIIGRFVFYYKKSRLPRASLDEKTKIIEVVVDMLSTLDISSISHKSLFGLLRVLKPSDGCRDKIESMIGLQLDRASLDNFLVPTPIRARLLYDVDLILRFLKYFIGKGACCVPLSRLKKVARLIDLYLAEVAPDPYLRPSKFLALIKALPDSARDSFDAVYHAVNLYLEVHSDLSEERRMKLCIGINYEKLSLETFKHLTRNTKFCPRSTAIALVAQQRKLKSLLHDATNDDENVSTVPRVSMMGRDDDEGGHQIVLYAKKMLVSNENEKMKAHLEGMQWRVVELERVCRKMQVKMSKMMKSRSQNSTKSVHMLCS